MGGLVEGRKGFRIFKLADQVLAMANQQDRVVGIGREQAGIETVGASSVAGYSQHLGQHTGDGRVGRVCVVQLLNQRQSLGLILSGQHGGQLRGQRRVVRRVLQGGAEEGFSFRVLFSSNQQVSQSGIGR